MKVCKQCNKKRSSKSYYGRQAICKKCHSQNVNYGKIEIKYFTCYRCSAKCPEVKKFNGLMGANKISVGTTRVCRKCLYKEERKCLTCNGVFWGTGTSKYCGKCRKASKAKVSNRAIGFTYREAVKEATNV